MSVWRSHIESKPTKTTVDRNQTESTNGSLSTRHLTEGHQAFSAANRKITVRINVAPYSGYRTLVGNPNAASPIVAIPFSQCFEYTRQNHRSFWSRTSFYAVWLRDGPPVQFVFAKLKMSTAERNWRLWIARHEDQQFETTLKRYITTLNKMQLPFC